MGARATGGASMRAGPAPQAARARATRTTAKSRTSLTGAPSGLAADAVVDAEEVVRVHLLLDRKQPRVVDAPERALPVRLEVVGLVGVGARPRGRVADDLHRPGDHICRSLASGEVRLVTGDPGYAPRSLAAAMIRQAASRATGFTLVCRSRAIAS